MRRRWLLLCLLAGVALFAQACNGGEQDLPELNQPIKLVVTLRESMSFAPFIIAQEEGYFTEQGLDIEFVPAPRSTEAMVALVQKDIDVYASTFSVGIFNAMAHGEPVKMVANKGFFDPDGCTYHAFSVRTALYESGEVTSAVDLVGRKVSFRLGTLPSYLMDMALEPFGYSSLDVIDVDIPSEVEDESLQEGSVDAVSHAEPTLSRSVNLGASIPIIHGKDVLPGAAWGMVIFGPSLIEDHPDAGRRFMAAYLMAVRQYNQGKTERNLDILEAATGLERELLVQSCWPPITQDGRLDIESVMKFQDWAVQMGYLEEVASEEQFWDSRFIEYANDILD